MLLQEHTTRLKRWAKTGPSTSELNYFLGNADKSIQLIKDFEEENETVYAYLCVIDEIYPDLGKRLEKMTERYEPSG